MFDYSLSFNLPKIVIFSSFRHYFCIFDRLNSRSMKCKALKIQFLPIFNVVINEIKFDCWFSFIIL